MQWNWKLTAATALTVVCVVLISGGLVQLNSSDSNDADPGTYSDTDIVGHWYALEVQGYNSSGVYFEDQLRSDGGLKITLGTVRLSEYAIDVVYTQDGLIYGSFMNMPVTGTCLMGVVEFKITAYDGDSPVDFWMRGHLVDADTMVISAYSYANTLSSDSSVGSVIVYSKNYGETPQMPTPSLDLSGEWHGVSANRYTAGGYTPLENFDLQVEQNGPTFWMQVYLAGNVFNSLAGAYSYAGGSDPAMLAAYNSWGHHWFGEYRDGALYTFEYVAEDGDLVCNMRIYTRDGAAASESSAVAAEQRAQDWQCTYADSMDGASVTRTTMLAVTHNVISYGNLCFAEISTEAGTISAVKYYESTSPVFMIIGTLDAAGELSYAFAAFETDELVRVSLLSNDGTSSQWRMEPVLDEYNPVGHWAAAYECCYSSDGTYHSSTGVSLASSPYSFEVYWADGEVFYGSFEGTAVCGTMIDGMLRFKVQNEDGFLQARFVQINQRTALYSAALYDGDGASTAYSAVLTNVHLDSAEAPKITSYDYSGLWNMVPGTGWSYNGTEKVLLAGTRLNIEKVTGDVFTGTMEQVVGSAVVEKEICGAAVCETGGILRLLAIDNYGLSWFFYVDVNAGKILAVTMQTSQIDEFDQQVMAAQRVYTRDGTGSDVMPAVNIEGTVWTEVSREAIKASGEYEDQELGATVKVEAQDGCAFRLTINYGGYLNEGVGYLVGTAFGFIIQSEGGEPEICYGELVGDTMIITAHMHGQVTGKYMAVVWHLQAVSG